MILFLFIWILLGIFSVVRYRKEFPKRKCDNIILYHFFNFIIVISSISFYIPYISVKKSWLFKYYKKYYFLDDENLDTLKNTIFNLLKKREYITLNIFFKLNIHDAYLDHFKNDPRFLIENDVIKLSVVEKRKLKLDALNFL